MLRNRKCAAFSQDLTECHCYRPILDGDGWKALPLMPLGGVIVLNKSRWRLQGRPANGVYSATKAAVRSFARTWTNDLKDRQVRVNAISPGVTETQGFRDLMTITRARRRPASMTTLCNLSSRPRTRA